MNTIAKPDVYTYPLTRWMNKLYKGITLHIPVLRIHSEPESVTVQVIEDGIVTHCTHAQTKLDNVSHAYFVNGEIEELTRKATVCIKDNCQAWQNESGEWNE